MSASPATSFDKRSARNAPERSHAVMTINAASSAIMMTAPGAPSQSAQVPEDSAPYAISAGNIGSRLATLPRMASGAFICSAV